MTTHHDKDEELEQDLDSENGVEITDEIVVESSDDNVKGSATLEEKLRLEVRENFDKYIRAVAELENYKKRMAKERSELLKYAGEYLARDLLDVADNLERALLQNAPAESNPFYEGVRLIHSSLVSVFERHSIKPESALGKLFDPARQEALASVPTAEQPLGTVLEEYRKAYFFKDKLLRPGQVVVASALPVAPSESEVPKPVSGEEEDPPAQS